MTELGIWGWTAGLIQLTIPSYALRLVRRFGTEQVGWFVTLAFIALALLHLVTPFQPDSFGFGVFGDLVYLTASILLLVGMGHLESILFERGRLAEQECHLQARVQQAVQERTTALLADRQGLLAEMTRRTQAVESLQASEERYRLLFEFNPLAMWLYEPRTLQLLDSNTAAQRQLGFSPTELHAQSMKSLLVPGSVETFTKANSLSCSQVHCLGILHFRTKMQNHVSLELMARDLPIEKQRIRLVVAQEANTEALDETQLRQNLSVAWLSDLAESLARPLANAMLQVEEQARLLAVSSSSAQAIEPLQHVAQIASRVGDVAHQLLAAGCRHSLNPELIDLQSFLLELDASLRKACGERIELQYDGGQELPPVLADTRLLQRLVLNLVQNSCEAMPQGGSVRICTRSIFLPQARVAGQKRSGTFVCLSISDNGGGLPPEVQARLFEPFQSSRRPEGHAGLGLSAALGIARQHLGWIECATEAGAGTQFKLFLPSVADARVLSLSPEAAPRELFMLIYPEGRLRALLRFALEQRGYRVVEADSAAQALKLWHSHAMHIRLLLIALSLEASASPAGLGVSLHETRADVPILFLNDITAGAPPRSPRLQTTDCYLPTPLAMHNFELCMQELLALVEKMQAPSC